MIAVTAIWNFTGARQNPNIKRLAEQGLTFRRCYQAAPMCSPTRHALYTGLYPVRSGAYPNHAWAYENVQSIPHYLSRGGYRVGLAGRLTLLRRPFSVWYLKEFADPLIRMWPWLTDGVTKKYCSSCVSRLKNRSHSVCFSVPRTAWPYSKGDPRPYENAELSPQQFDFQRDEYAKYLGEITYFDGQVGEIADMVDQLGLKQNTRFIVATEQGMAFLLASGPVTR